MRLRKGKPTRKESLEICITGKGKLSPVAEEAYADLIGFRREVGEHDEWQAAYTLNLEYWNSCDKQLSAIISLLGEDNVRATHLDVQEILHGKSILVDLMEQLDALQRRLDEQN